MLNTNKFPKINGKKMNMVINGMKEIITYPSRYKNMIIKINNKKN